MSKSIDSESVGSATIDQFFEWINERHAIHQRKVNGEPKPWTSDEIMQNFKFTNVFRQLDAGTVHLTGVLLPALHDPTVFLGFACEQTDELLKLVLFNIITYRMYNLVETQERLGFIRD